MINDLKLNKKEQVAIKELTKQLQTSAFIRFWDSSIVQIDGDLTLPELTLLVKIMKRLQDAQETL